MKKVYLVITKWDIQWESSDFDIQVFETYEKACKCFDKQIDDAIQSFKDDYDFSDDEIDINKYSDFVDDIAEITGNGGGTYYVEVRIREKLLEDENY